MLGLSAVTTGHGAQLGGRGDDRRAIALRWVDPRDREVVAIAPVLPSVEGQIHTGRRGVVNARSHRCRSARIACAVERPHDGLLRTFQELLRFDRDLPRPVRARRRVGERPFRRGQSAGTPICPTFPIPKDRAYALHPDVVLRVIPKRLIAANPRPRGQRRVHADRRGRRRIVDELHFSRKRSNEVATVAGARLELAGCPADQTLHNLCCAFCGGIGLLEPRPGQRPVVELRDLLGADLELLPETVAVRRQALQHFHLIRGTDGQQFQPPATILSPTVSGPFEGLDERPRRCCDRHDRPRKVGQVAGSQVALRDHAAITVAVRVAVPSGPHPACGEHPERRRAVVQMVCLTARDPVLTRHRRRRPHKHPTKHPAHHDRSQRPTHHRPPPGRDSGSSVAAHRV